MQVLISLCEFGQVWMFGQVQMILEKSSMSNLYKRIITYHNISKLLYTYHNLSKLSTLIFEAKMFILQAADSFTMIHYLEYVLQHTYQQPLRRRRTMFAPPRRRFASTTLHAYCHCTYTLHRQLPQYTGQHTTTEAYCSDELTNTAACAQSTLAPLV